MRNIEVSEVQGSSLVRVDFEGHYLVMLNRFEAADLVAKLNKQIKLLEGRDNARVQELMKAAVK